MKKSDKKRNGFNTNAYDRVRINQEIEEILKDWPEGIRPTVGKLEAALGLGAGFLRHHISRENLERMRDVADLNAGPRGNWRMDPEYLAEFPQGEKRPYGKAVPSDDELRRIVREAIEIAGRHRPLHVDALAKMAGCNRTFVMAAMPEDASLMLKRHNRSVSEEKKRGLVGDLVLFDDDMELIKIQDIMEMKTKFGWIAAKASAENGALVKELLSFYAELPLELQQQEEDTAFDALLCANSRDGGKYVRKVALVVVDREGEGWSVDSVSHSEIAATADLLRAELVYLLRDGDELAHTVRRASSLPVEVGSETTDITPE